MWKIPTRHSFFRRHFLYKINQAISTLLRVTYDVLLDNFIAKFFVVVIHTQILLYSTYIGNEQHRLNSIFIHIILVGIPRP